MSIRVLVTTAALIVTSASALAQAPDEPTRASLDRVFSMWSSKDGPGCSVGASRDGKTVYEAGYGSANLEADVPITPTSIFHAASVSKQFTAMRLVHRGHSTRPELALEAVPAGQGCGQTRVNGHCFRTEAEPRKLEPAAASPLSMRPVFAHS